MTGCFASEHHAARERYESSKPQPRLQMPPQSGSGINVEGIRHRIRCTVFSREEIEAVLYGEDS